MRSIWRWALRVPRAVGLLVKRIWSSRLSERFVRTPLRTNRVVQATVGAVLAITITGLFPPADLVRSTVTGVGDIVLPGPSDAEESVDALYEEVEDASLWRSPPSMNAEAKEMLVDDWDGLRPDRPRKLSAAGAKEVELDDLFQDFSLDRRRVVVRAYVSQLYAQIPVPDHDDLVSTSFRLGVGEHREEAWCARATLPRDRSPRFDQFVVVVGVVLARGSANVADGGFVNGTYLLCSAVDPVGGTGQAEEIAALFRGEEESTAWKSPPSLSAGGRRFLTRAWGRLNPYEPHAFPASGVTPVGIDHVYEDSRFDGRLLGVSGYIAQRDLHPADDGQTLERIKLWAAGQDYAVWCVTTVQNWRVFDEDELVEAVGVPIARGSSEVESGGFGNRTVLACPAVRRG